MLGFAASVCADPIAEFTPGDVQTTGLGGDALVGLNLTDAMEVAYESIASQYGLVCGSETGGPGVGGSNGLTAGSTPPPEASQQVRGWTGTIWIGQFEDYELRDVDKRRVLLVSADPVPPPHDGYLEPIATGVTLIVRQGMWDVGRVAQLFDCSGDSDAPLPDRQDEIAKSRKPALRYESFVEYVEDGDQGLTDQRFAILEIGDPEDWPPALDLPPLAELLTETARERWAVEFACVIVTRRSVESGDAGTGLPPDSPLPVGVLAIFEELRFDPEQASLRLIGERNIVLGWVEPHGDAGRVSGVEFVRTGTGEWSERTWVSMYGCDAFGG